MASRIPEIKGISVLVVDDDSMHRFLLNEFVSRAGGNCVTVASGMEAVQLIKSGHEFDVVLLDSSMWGMDGYETSREIKAISDIYVIMISGYTSHEHMEKAFGAGCDRYLTKPVSREELLSEILVLKNKMKLKI